MTALRVSKRTFACAGCDEVVTLVCGNRRSTCSAECARAARRRTRPKFVVRALAKGEAIPASEPLKYRHVTGYVMLRWQLDDGTFVEVLEHRVFDGRNTDAENVHHINHIRDDNRSENLMCLTADEHQKIHHAEHHQQHLQWADLYRSGFTTSEIAEAFLTHAGNVSRALRKLNVDIRQPSEYAAPVPDAEVIARYLDGEGATSIARDLHISLPRIHAALRAGGVELRPAGRVPRKGVSDAN